jgi:S1-C subfamily serine protease
VELDGTPLATTSDLTRYLRKKRPGEVAHLTFYRGNRRMTVDVKLTDRSE